MCQDPNCDTTLNTPIPLQEILLSLCSKWIQNPIVSHHLPECHPGLSACRFHWAFAAASYLAFLCLSSPHAICSQHSSQGTSTTTPSPTMVPLGSQPFSDSCFPQVRAGNLPVAPGVTRRLPAGLPTTGPHAYSTSTTQPGHSSNLPHKLFFTTFVPEVSFSWKVLSAIYSTGLFIFFKVLG